MEEPSWCVSRSAAPLILALPAEGEGAAEGGVGGPAPWSRTDLWIWSFFWIWS